MMGRNHDFSPLLGRGPVHRRAEMHPANKSTAPLNADFLACQVVSVAMARCAVAKGPNTRYPEGVTNQRFTRSKDGNPSPK